MDVEQSRDARFGYVLKHAQYALRQAMDDRLEAVDLTTPQYAALTALEREDGLSNAEVARRCFVTPQTMHSIVTRLEEEGLLQRTPHPDHGRIQQLHLTDGGQARLDQGHEIVTEIEDGMTEEVTEEELEQAKSVLIRSTAALRET
ncbi:MAG: MarR family transcriptional regulator [Bacteroidetes bacterium SW_9_63_38]|nr:MAG: MarR family transcriptional regulator [Bacteroidetes bacterium SW_9_63_38]